MSTLSSISAGKGWHIYVDRAAQKDPFSDDWDHIWIEIDQCYWKGDADGEIKVLITKDTMIEILKGMLDINFGQRVMKDLAKAMNDNDDNQED